MDVTYKNFKKFREALKTVLRIFFHYPIILCHVTQSNERKMFFLTLHRISFSIFVNADDVMKFSDVILILELLLHVGSIKFLLYIASTVY